MELHDFRGYYIVRLGVLKMSLSTLAIMQVIIYGKTMNMMCVEIWYHSGDIKVGMQRQCSLELAKNSIII